MTLPTGDVPLLDTLVLTLREIAVSQLRAAVLAYASGDWACAITLAGAAEGRCPKDDAALHRVLRVVAKARPDRVDDKALNDVANRMKHSSNPANVEVRHGYVMLMLVRAVTTVENAYGRSDDAIAEFASWVREHGVAMPTSEALDRYSSS